MIEQSAARDEAPLRPRAALAILWPVELSSHQLAQFAQDGYLVLADAFGPREVARMRAEADRILELIINSSLHHMRTSGRLDLTESGAGEQQVRKIQPINDLSLYLSEIAADDRLLQPMRQLMGDEPVPMEEKLNYKEPLPERLTGLDSSRATSAFPLHSDWAHYKAQGYPQSIVSSAIAIDTCTAASGAIHVWPGTHTEHREHRRTDGDIELPPESIDPQAGVDVLASAGSIMLFHSLLVHNSRPNVSGRPRRVMIYSHYPAGANMGHDVRNGPNRLREAPWEWEYIRTRPPVGSFHAPQFDAAPTLAQS